MKVSWDSEQENKASQSYEVVIMVKPFEIMKRLLAKHFNLATRLNGCVILVRNVGLVGLK